MFYPYSELRSALCCVLNVHKLNGKHTGNFVPEHFHFSADFFFFYSVLTVEGNATKTEHLIPRVIERFWCLMNSQRMHSPSSKPL